MAAHTAHSKMNDSHIVRKNIIFNFAGQFWTGLISLAFVPVYIRLMGIESYGLFGVLGSIAALVSVLDFGLGITTNRETAKWSARPEGAGIGDFLRTCEWIYWVEGLAIGLMVYSIAGWIAEHWVTAHNLDKDQIKQAVALTGISIACRWPSTFYLAGLQGLQKQVVTNTLTSGAMALRSLGSAAVLWLISPTLKAFLITQIVSDILLTFGSALYLRHFLPHTTGRFDPAAIRKIWRFSAGMAINGLSYILLTQIDRLVLSRVLSLETFGWYFFASVAASTLLKIAAPVQNALFPRFTELIHHGNLRELARVYSAGTQFLSVLIFPPMLLVCLFSAQLLLAWTGNTATAENTYQVLRILTIGTALHGIMYLPYSMQISHGWTWLNTAANVVSLAIQIPALILLGSWFGASGAACVWVVVNLGALLIVVPIMHKRILTGLAAEWFIQDLGLPLIAGLIALLPFWYFAPSFSTRFGIVAWCAISLFAGVVGASLGADRVRVAVFEQAGRLFRPAVR
jgi:O-antigen/teichoic acid export membrane protein